MKGTSHLTAGIITGVAIAPYTNINPLITVGLISLGSIIVDIDEIHSFANRILFPVKVKYRNYLKGLIGIIMLSMPFNIFKYLGAIIILSLISSKVKYQRKWFFKVEKRVYHRTIFHDPIIGLIIFGLPFAIIPNIPLTYAFSFLIGVVLCHYLLDMFNDYGLPLYLLGGKRIRMPIHYNSRNKSIEYTILALYIGLIIYLQQTDILKNLIINITKLLKF